MCNRLLGGWARSWVEGRWAAQKIHMHTQICIIMAVMAVKFLDPLGRGGKPSDIPCGICWLNLVVLVERADRYLLWF